MSVTEVIISKKATFQELSVTGAKPCMRSLPVKTVRRSPRPRQLKAGLGLVMMIMMGRVQIGELRNSHKSLPRSCGILMLASLEHSLGFEVSLNRPLALYSPGSRH